MSGDAIADNHVERGLNFRVFIKDHQPPHVHVVKAGTTVVIYLGDDNTRPSIRENYDMNTSDIRKALEITAENQDAFLKKWRKYHAKK